MINADHEFDDRYTHYADLAIKVYRLEKLWAYAQEHHTKGLGYHNLNHIRCVMGMAYELALLERADVFVCVVAAMFHDIGHTGRGGPNDATNIAKAIRHLGLAYRGDGGGRLYVPDSVVHCITSTQYDGSQFPVPPTTKEACIVRDADLCLPFLQPENARTLILGLGMEMKAWNGITFYTKGLPGSIDFYSKVVWHTPTMQARREEGLARLEALYKLGMPHENQ